MIPILGKYLPTWIERQFFQEYFSMNNFKLANLEKGVELVQNILSKKVSIPQILEVFYTTIWKVDMMFQWSVVCWFLLDLLVHIRMRLKIRFCLKRRNRPPREQASAVLKAFSKSHWDCFHIYSLAAWAASKYEISNRILNACKYAPINSNNKIVAHTQTNQ